MVNYDKTEIKEQITEENIYSLLCEWGGEPEYTNFGILSATICHNEPGIGSRKLYWYSNSNLFRCYTGCEEPTFDIFELTIKVFFIQKHQKINLNEAVRYIAFKFGIIGTDIIQEEYSNIEDWQYLNSYDRIQKIKNSTKPELILKTYDSSILDRLNYSIKIKPWLDEGISQEAINYNRIGYYLGGDQVTIPHFDKDNRFIGLRGRSMCQQECDLYGKYRPIIINKQMYNHPLGLNLYNLNNSKNNIATYQAAIIFESEKSVLLYQTYFGFDKDISVACCGSNLSEYQVYLLKENGAKTIIVAFDRQFQEIGDTEHQHLKNNLLKLYNKYHKDINIQFIFDVNMITSYKASPIDEGKDKFLKLFNERIKKI